jgi:uncharacterized protein (TIGR03083 family)
VERAVARAELLAMVRQARARWDALLARVPRERMTEPGLPGGWSVKDVVAHVAWGEREAAGVVAARALVGSELWKLDQDERNAAVHAQERDRPLDEVLADAERVFASYLVGLASLSEEELNDPRHFRDMPADWRPWRVLYDPHHYDAHAADIAAWLEDRPPNPS